MPLPQLEHLGQNPFEESDKNGESEEALLRILTIRASEMRLKISLYSRRSRRSRYMDSALNLGSWLINRFGLWLTRVENQKIKKSKFVNPKS